MKPILSLTTILLFLFSSLTFAQETLFFDGFENETSEWQFLDIDGDGRNWTIANINPNNGLNCLYGGYSPTMEDNWAISPAVPLPVYDGITMLEWQVFAHVNYIETYEILVTTGIENILVSYDSLFGESVTGGYHSRQIDLSAYAGQTIHIAFRHRSQNQNFICIDDVSIKHYEQQPPQPPIVEIAAPTTAKVGEEVILSARCENADQFLWDIEGAEVSNPEGRTIKTTWSNSGRYRISVTATNQDGSATADHIITIVSNNGIADNTEQTNNPLLYPNPAVDMIHSTLPSATSIAVMDAAGVVVAYSKSGSVGIAHLPSGIYYAIITSDKGSVTKPFVKSH